MVPTEEERLPVRVSISVRGLSSRLLSQALLPTIRFVMSHSFFSRIAMVMLHAGLKPERTLLFLSQTILLIEFPYCVRHLCTFLARYWPAVSVVRHGYMIINSISAHLVVVIVVSTGCSVR